jgi:hypothetical protein
MIKMERIIWKYPLTISDFQLITMPTYAEILSVQVQNDIPCIWALVNPDPEAEMEMRRFEIYGTGHTIQFDMGVDRKYIGTFMTNNDKLVWHLFERIS